MSSNRSYSFGLFVVLACGFLGMARAICRPSMEKCNLGAESQAGALPTIQASASSNILAGSLTSATLNFEPGGWENLFNWMYYYVPPGFTNSYPRSPDNVPVSDSAIEYGMSDGVSEWHLDISPSGLITLTGKLIEMDINLYTAVVSVSSAAFGGPRSGGVVKVSDNFTYPVTAELSGGALQLKAPGAHISELWTFVAAFQLTACAPGSPCCDADGNLKPQGTQCRSAQGPCANPAVCTGQSSVCPDNPIKPAGTVCGSGGACKQQPFCDGRNAACPGGSNRPERTPCLRDGEVKQYPYAQRGSMSLDACKGQCAKGTCQLKLNKQGCCYTSETVNRKTVKTVHCW